MLKIRLKRVGRKHDPSFRVIVTEAGRGVKSGKYIDMIGSYDPRVDRKDIDATKAKDWLARGAQPTDTVYNLLVDAGAIAGRKKNVLPKKSAPVAEAPVEEVATEEPIAEEPVVETEAQSEETVEEAPTPTEEA